LKKSKEDKSGKDELFQLSIFNDVLDIFLFLVGLFIPLGDFFESIVGGSFDVMLLIWLYPLLKKNIVWVFLVECLDIGDLFFFMGKFDFIGWIEILPMWYWVYKQLLIKEEYAKKKQLSSQEKDLVSLSKSSKICPVCNVKIPSESNICEYCGSDLSKIKT
jgi:hypothetical protein